jgi:hypothetical protein
LSAYQRADWVGSGPPDEIPAAVNDRLLDMLDRLAALAQRLLELAAVCGPRVHHAFLVAAADLADDHYERVVDQLLDNGRAYRCYCSKERLEKLREEAMGIVKDVYERGRPRWSGLLSRPGDWWDFRLYPHSHGDGGWSKWFFAAHQAEELRLEILVEGLALNRRAETAP